MSTFNWDVSLDSTKKTSKTTRVIKFGDGYEQRQKEGIAPALEAWSASKTAKEAEIDAIESFLLNHTVTPFLWDPCNKGVKKYVLDGEINRSTLGAGWARISWTAREVRA